MANFVLVAGARLGAWAWGDVVPCLAAGGHGVHPVTLSGLAERRGVPAGQATHVRDIVEAVEGLDLRDVVLVGHSYAGVPVGQAAERLGDRLARVVFVDAEVPVDGAAFVGSWPDGGAAVKASIAENGGFWPVAPASHFEGHGLTGEQIARIVSGSTPHPGATMTEPAVLDGSLAGLPVTYIRCTLGEPAPGADDTAYPAEVLGGAHWEVVDMESGHWPMFSAPRALARLLLNASDR